MVYGPTYDSFEQAYLAVLRTVARRHQYETNGRGKKAREIINSSFTITDPVDRTPYLAARRTNIVFNHAEALWYLTGRDDLDMIGYYAPRLRDLAIEGRLTGTAYGPRLFTPNGPDGRSQFDRVVSLLREDPDTKRAAMVIMRPDELTDPTHPDVACTLGLQFLLRDGALHAAAYMRGNDAVIGLLCDTFSFTFLQEYTARRLGVEVGTYAHHVGSMHVNLLDLDRVDAILAEAAGPTARPRFPVPSMPATSHDDLALVMAWEESLRTNTRRLDPVRLDRVSLPLYWQQVLALFEVYRQIVHDPDGTVGPDAMAALHPGHRWLVARRWPDRMPATIRAGWPS
ncbi:thymidylate synthase [Micromonospora sp. WMMA1363]|uniref:thymidylate synthase n=1 Tax=Micromonospora sp. WMMA1363 TaxID=3053985 RepID=UPI00259C7376|nr:thymidylate synthase [Micromonospora sp. WMMA1363]MDM4721379.1 thymidylate synthase [Micromonospora sp. WMMA1363]